MAMIKLQLATAIILLVLLLGLLFNVLMYPFFTEFIDYRLQHLYPSISSTSLKIFRVSIYDYGTFAVVAAMVIALLGAIKKNLKNIVLVNIKQENINFAAYRLL